MAFAVAPSFLVRALVSGGGVGLSGPVTTQTASPGALDPLTVAAIRDALGAAQRGGIDEAIATAERGLATGGDIVALNALLGMLRGQAGDSSGAIRHLEIAHRAKPDDVRIATNLASALGSTGDYKRALAVATRALAFSDPTLQLARMRGYLAQMHGDPAAAVEAYEHVVDSAPDDWESWNNLGNARNALDDGDGSLAALERSCALNPHAAPTQLNLARTYRLVGRWDDAETTLRKMADAFPQDIRSLTDLHDLLKERGRDDKDILEVLERAVRREPSNIDLLTMRARHLALMLEMEQAENAFRAILAQDSANADAFLGLAISFEHNRPSALSDLADEAQRSAIDPPALALVQAFAHRRANRHAEGVAALQSVPPEFESGRRDHLLGQMLEGLGDYDGAFASFERMNRIQSEDSSQPLVRAEAFRAAQRAQLDRLDADWIGGWKTPPIATAQPAPIFLVGFPRSGTTLLDTLLMGHPDVEVMEERPVINRVESEFGGLDAIPSLDEAAVRHAQARYFEIAAEYANVGGGALIVDKSPLLLNDVPTIHRLFPDARFILALRHPVDVILSCFVSNFRLNPAMANFLQLDTAAEFYDLTFRSWEAARALFPIEVHTMGYEQLVEDPEGELRRLSDGLGLRWHGDMLDHTKTAAARGVISTASYAQVTEPIYTRSVGRWHHYRKHLEPIFPALAPWVEKFGYGL